MNKKRILLKNTVIFFISNIIPKTISFLLIPLYTNKLSTIEYGTYDLINTTVALFIPIYTLNLRDAVLRFCIKNKEHLNTILGGTLLVIAVNTIPTIFMCVLASLFLPQNIKTEYILMFIWYLLANSLYDVLIAYCKGIGRVKIILYVSILNSIITILSNMVLVLFANAGLFGFLVSNVLGTTLSAILCFIMVKGYNVLSPRNHFEVKILKEMVAYSAPMILSALAWWVNNASDRYILGALVSTSMVGVYATSSKIPTILHSIQSVFMQAWSISAITHYDKNDKDNFINGTFKTLSSLLFIVCSLILVMLLPLSGLLFKKEFNTAWFFVPPLLVSVIFDSFSIFIGQIFYAVKATRVRMWATIIGAALNTIFNILLIPILGPYGAALATLSGYIVSFIYSVFIVRRYILIKINYGVYIVSFATILIQMILYSLKITNILPQVVLCLLIILTNREQVKSIIKFIKNKGVTK